MPTAAATYLKCEMLPLLYFLELSTIYQNTLTYAEYILLPSGQKTTSYRLCHSTFFPPKSFPYLGSPCDSLIFLPSKRTGTFNYIDKNGQNYSQSTADRVLVLLQILTVRDFLKHRILIRVLMN